MSKKIIVTVLVVVALLAGILTFIIRRNFEVEVVAPKRGEIVEAIYSLGKVKSRNRFDLKLGVISTVESLYVREGDYVKKNAPLIKFTDSGLFRAPFNGVVTLLSVNLGESAAPSMVLLRLDDLNDKYIEVSLEQQGALRVQKGQPAEVVFETMRGEKLNGRVTALFSKNDEFLANIEVDGLKENVLPGMTADVAIIVGRHQDALLIPVRAISNGHVTVQRNRKRIKVPVKIGAIDSQMAEILESDLKETDQILIRTK